MKNTCQKIIAVVASAVLAMTAMSSLQASNTQTTKGMRPTVTTPLHTEAQFEALHPGDTVAMVCTMCKSVTTVTYSSDADSKGHVKWMHPGTEMDCPGCGGTITVSGGGTGKQAGITHVCSKCGGESAFCCASKRGKKTVGMEGMNGVNGMKMP